MDRTKQNLISETFAASNEGRIHFGEIVKRMMEAGVESYSVDYLCHHATYYLENDETLVVGMEATPLAISKNFDASAIQ